MGKHLVMKRSFGKKGETCAQEQNFSTNEHQLNVHPPNFSIELELAQHARSKMKTKTVLNLNLNDCYGYTSIKSFSPTRYP